MALWANTCIFGYFFEYLAASAAKYCIAKEGSGSLKTYWQAGWHWPPAGKLWISGIQKVETSIFEILDPNWLIFIKFLRKSSFTESVGLIIGFSRCGMCFSSCPTSSTYFSITKKCIFLRYNFLLCVLAHIAQPLKLISGPCSIEKYPSSRMANRYTRIFDAGWLWACAQWGIIGSFVA